MSTKTGKVLTLFSANTYPSAAGNRLQGREKGLEALMNFPILAKSDILLKFNNYSERKKYVSYMKKRKAVHFIIEYKREQEKEKGKE